MGSHRSAANELTYLWGLLFSLRRIWWLCFCGINWDPLQLWTARFDANVRAVKHSATCQLIFHALLPMFEWIDRMWGLRCHNYHIRQFELKLEPWLYLPDSNLFSLSSLFKRGLKLEGRWNRRHPRGIFISEISSTCALYTDLKRSLYHHAKSSESIDKRTTVLLQSAELCQRLVKINDTSVPCHWVQTVYMLSWSHGPHFFLTWILIIRDECLNPNTE